MSEILTREQVSKAFIGLYHDGASQGQRKTFDLLLAHDAALRQQLSAVEAHNIRLAGTVKEVHDLRNERNQLREMHDRIAAIPAVADGLHAPSEENVADGVDALAEEHQQAKAALAAVTHERDEAKCGEALCGHDHSTQYWERRANEAQARLRVVEGDVHVTGSFAWYRAGYHRQAKTVNECCVLEESMRQRLQAVEGALSNLLREAGNVANDHHKPRYGRLDESIASAHAALATPKGPT
jgi:uncharacterized low-complexity protein